MVGWWRGAVLKKKLGAEKTLWWGGGVVQCRKKSWVLKKSCGGWCSAEKKLQWVGGGVVVPCSVEKKSCSGLVVGAGPGGGAVVGWWCPVASKKRVLVVFQLGGCQDQLSDATANDRKKMGVFGRFSITPPTQKMRGGRPAWAHPRGGVKGGSRYPLAGYMTGSPTRAQSKLRKRRATGTQGRAAPSH